MIDWVYWIGVVGSITLTIWIATILWRETYGKKDERRKN